MMEGLGWRNVYTRIRVTERICSRQSGEKLVIRCLKLQENFTSKSIVKLNNRQEK